MARRLRPEDLIKLDRPFCIFVEPGDVDEDGDVQWYAKIVGHELDQMTSGDNALDAVDSAMEVLAILAGICPGGTDHNWIVDLGDRWECGKCGEIARKDAIVDDVPTEGVYL